MSRSATTSTPERRASILAAAETLGVTTGDTGRIAARIKMSLITAAKQRSGIASDTALLEYALARVALEDDFGAKLLARKGKVPADIDLEL
jgi:hypothetical protein